MRKFFHRNLSLTIIENLRKIRAASFESILIHYSRVALLRARVVMAREKYLENDIFSRSGKSQGIFMDGQRNLERTWKVREFEYKWLWQAVYRKFIYSVQEGKGCTFSKIVYAHLPPLWGLLLKE